jgi:hypothetical protein
MMAPAHAAKDEPAFGLQYFVLEDAAAHEGAIVSVPVATAMWVQELHRALDPRGLFFFSLRVLSFGPPP